MGLEYAMAAMSVPEETRIRRLTDGSRYVPDDPVHQTLHRACG